MTVITREKRETVQQSQRNAESNAPSESPVKGSVSGDDAVSEPLDADSSLGPRRQVVHKYKQRRVTEMQDYKRHV